MLKHEKYLGLFIYLFIYLFIKYIYAGRQNQGRSPVFHLVPAMSIKITFIKNNKILKTIIYTYLQMKPTIDKNMINH